MGSVIATNIASINAQRNLYGTSNGLNVTFQRLSSGFRINTAKDDAAGLQISNKLSSQIGGLTVAARNANDGISLSQVAEGAVGEATNLLQRMRDLAVQSANGSNGPSERSALQQEVAQLKSELNRIAETTRFGSAVLLNGSFGSRSFQVGANAFETISVTMGNVRADATGSYRVDTSAGVNLLDASATLADNATNAVNAVAGDTITLSGFLGTQDITYAAGSTARDIANAVNFVSSETGINAAARTVAQLSSLALPGTLSFQLYGSNTSTTNPIIISATVTDVTDLSAISDAVNRVNAETGVSAEIVVDPATGDKNVHLISETGTDIKIADFNNSAGANGTIAMTPEDFNGLALAGSTAATLTPGAATDSAVVAGMVRFDSSRSYTVTSLAADIFAAIGTQSAGLEQVANLSIATGIGAQEAIIVIDKAIEAIDSVRGDLGAVQNRFISTISNLNSVNENVAASRSRIRDTDFAQETANLSKFQVLQQAGLSVLAQANAQGQSVLQLLQG
ncbi:flagellin [Permianibacter sp. IMCC34836]|uniref:flagellin N-terminal helical domain-containing protein n=1 Tax=Permianibacter fluminis TaxID=2738515 RepID=UPI0015561391|nr:flagellin [Permianibacter fluminis]NQD38044.1 flagellin [Permianibacter fluminis]